MPEFHDVFWRKILHIFQSRREERELLEEEIMGRQKQMTLYERALQEGIEQGMESILFYKFGI